MKLAAALLCGVATAKYDDAMSALKIQVKPWGQKKIEKEAMDVRRTAKKISNWPATKRLEGALKNWAHSKAAYQLRALDKKFLRSPAGQKLIKEWKDVGRVLKNNVVKTRHGVHFNNGAVNRLSAELDDVSDHYEYLGTTHWNAKYNNAYKNLFTNRAFRKVKMSANAFKHSKAGHMLHKEVSELGQALKTHVKVTDIPPKWKKHMHGLRVELEDNAEENIHEAAHDVEDAWNDIKDSDVVQDLGKAAMEWGTSDEVEDLKALDEEFKASEEGQDLMAEWREFGRILHEAIEETPRGIHIDNDKFDDLEDQADEIKENYEELEETHWHEDFDHAFEQAFTNDEFENLHEAAEEFHDSEEREHLKDAVEDFFETVHDNVKVSDVPEEWMEELEHAHEEVEEMEDDMMLF